MTKKLKFRDEQVAEDVAKKAALGWLDTEIMVYGCAYLDEKNDKVFYKISTSEDELYRFMESSRLHGYYPSRMLTLKRRFEIPTGMKEVVARSVKIELARLLRNVFPKEFFYVLHRIADAHISNEAAEYLWAELSQYENSLDEDWLYRLELLINYAFVCNMINLETYKQFQLILQNERKYIGENFINKQRFQKVIYGFGYEKNGELKYIVDTQNSSIHRIFYALEAKGYLLSPIFSKQYWYHLCDELPNVIDSFKVELKANCDLIYMEKVKELRKRRHDRDLFDMEQLIVEVRNCYGEEAANTLLSYGYRWGICYR